MEIRYSESIINNSEYKKFCFQAKTFLIIIIAKDKSLFISTSENRVSSKYPCNALCLLEFNVAFIVGKIWIGLLLENVLEFRLL